jgi:hypothetical protein
MPCLKVFASGAKFPVSIATAWTIIRTPLLTTKITKATKVSDLDIFKLLNFVLFVTFVVKFAFSSLVAALPRWGSAVNALSQ